MSRRLPEPRRRRKSPVRCGEVDSEPFLVGLREKTAILPGCTREEARKKEAGATGGRYQAVRGCYPYRAGRRRGGGDSHVVIVGCRRPTDHRRESVPTFSSVPLVAVVGRLSPEHGRKHGNGATHPHRQQTPGCLHAARGHDAAGSPADRRRRRPECGKELRPGKLRRQVSYQPIRSHNPPTVLRCLSRRFQL